MHEEPTTAVIQRYLDALPRDPAAEPLVRELLERAAGRLRPLCATFLHKSYPRLTRPPVNLETDELLSGVEQRQVPGTSRWQSADMPRVLPKSKIGEAVGYTANQWPRLIRHVEGCRLTIDNAPAEPAIRPVGVGHGNWLQIAGDGGLKRAAVLLSVSASTKRHRVNPWAYVRHILTESPAHKWDAALSDLLPDA
jgi:hypothetical protein